MEYSPRIRKPIKPRTPGSYDFGLLALGDLGLRVYSAPLERGTGTVATGPPPKARKHAEQAYEKLIHDVGPSQRQGFGTVWFVECVRIMVGEASESRVSEFMAFPATGFDPNAICRDKFWV